MNNEVYSSSNNKVSIKCIFVFALVISIIGIIILNIYYSTPRYNHVEFENYNIYIPAGMAYEIQHEEDYNKLAFNDNNCYYDLRIINDSSYVQYKYDDYKVLREFFGKNNYQIKSIKEVIYENNSFIIAKLTSNNDNYYFYIYDVVDSDDLFVGYIYNTDESTEIESLNKLYDMLIKTKIRS